jgi:hypothetical protein
VRIPKTVDFHPLERSDFGGSMKEGFVALLDETEGRAPQEDQFVLTPIDSN